MKNGKILLFHRQAGVRAALKKALEQGGCTVIMAFSASSAENILRLEDIRAAFVDLRAEACDPLGTVERLQTIRPDLAIYALADTPSKFEIDACRKAGLQGYFTAPFNPAALANAVESIALPVSDGEASSAAKAAASG